MSSEWEKMLAGELYDPSVPDLMEARMVARERCNAINASSPREETLRRTLFAKLLGKVGNSLTIEPPFRCDYGSNIFLGDRVYFNFDCVILDVCKVSIGNDVLIAPGVHIYTATHPLAADQRRTQEFGKPVSIGNDVWIGGKAIICPGVTIGDRSVIGAGTVVTRDVPADVVCAGNPGKVIRRLER